MREAFEDLERALLGILPDGKVELRQCPSSERAAATRGDVCAYVDHLQFEVKLVKGASNAQLLDAAELLKMPQNSVQTIVPLLAVPYLSPARQELLRDARAPFIDYAGNAWIVAPGVYVDRRGFGNPAREDRDGRNVFSDKASLILRVLLHAPTPLGVRQIAEMVSCADPHIQLTPGYVSKVVKELLRRDYVAKRDDGLALRHGDELLSDWLDVYGNRKQPKPRRYFLPSPTAELLIPGLANAFEVNDVDYVLTGHAGASLVDRFADFDAVDIYVRNLDAADHVMEGMGARRVERGGNINVSLPYYWVSAFYELQTPQGSIKVASDVQLYLDLYDFPVRGREQAEHLYERRLRPVIEMETRR